MSPTPENSTSLRPPRVIRPKVMTGRDMATIAVNSGTRMAGPKGSKKSKGFERLTSALRPFRLFDHFDLLSSDLLSPPGPAIATIETLPTDYHAFSEESDWNLWQNRCFPNNMTIFSRLTSTVVVLTIAAWALAGPPRVTGNRPVVIDVPVPDADPPFSDPPSSRADRG